MDFANYVGKISLLSDRIEMFNFRPHRVPVVKVKSHKSTTKNHDWQCFMSTDSLVKGGPCQPSMRGIFYLKCPWFCAVIIPAPSKSYVDGGFDKRPAEGLEQKTTRTLRQTAARSFGPRVWVNCFSWTTAGASNERPAVAFNEQPTTWGSDELLQSVCDFKGSHPY